MRTFDQAIVRWDAKMLKMEEAVLETTLDMRREIQMGNPVKFGRSSASWNVQSPRMSKKKQPKSYYNVSESRFLDAVTNVGRYKLGWGLHVSNLQDYIQWLETSHREAAGWVRRTRTLYGEKLKQAMRKAMR
jgi:hypothetical protein